MNDLRVMELAVCLSGFILAGQNETIIWARIDAFLSGYGSSIKLTEEEIKVLPVLIPLRSLEVFIHFLGRYWDKVNSIDIVKQYIQKAAARGNWLSANKNTLISACTKNLLAKE